MLNDKLNAINELLSNQSYAEGFVPSQLDRLIFEALESEPDTKYDHIHRWYKHIHSFNKDYSTFTTTSLTLQTFLSSLNVSFQYCYLYYFIGKRKCLTHFCSCNL